MKKLLMSRLWVHSILVGVAFFVVACSEQQVTEMKARMGSADAQALLGLWHLTGDGVEQSDATAEMWVRSAVKQGNAHGELLLGMMYEEGKGVQRDYDEAIKWYRMSAIQNLADGQIALGLMYVYGKGVEQDDVFAHMWLSIAAAQGQDSEHRVAELLGLISERMTKEQIAEARKMARDWHEDH